MNTIQLLECTIKRNKVTIDLLHSSLRDIIDIIEKNEYVNKIEDLQSDNKDYIKSMALLIAHEME